MKRVYTFLSALFVSGLALAQQPQTPAPSQTTFTLDQCIEFALQNNITAENARVDREIAEARVKETIGFGLPQVSAGSSIVHNPQLSRFYMAYNPDSPFFPPGTVIPGVNPGDVVATRNIFQLQSSGDASATVNQSIFNGSY